MKDLIHIISLRRPLARRTVDPFTTYNPGIVQCAKGTCGTGCGTTTEDNITFNESRRLELGPLVILHEIHNGGDQSILCYDPLPPGHYCRLYPDGASCSFLSLGDTLNSQPGLNINSFTFTTDYYTYVDSKSFRQACF